MIRHTIRRVHLQRSLLNRLGQKTDLILQIQKRETQSLIQVITITCSSEATSASTSAVGVNDGEVNEHVEKTSLAVNYAETDCHVHGLPYSTVEEQDTTRKKYRE